MHLRIRGGRQLRGAVPIGGFKHALVPVLAAGALVDGWLTIENAPDIEDTRVLAEIFAGLGAQVTAGEGTVSIHTGALDFRSIPEQLSGRIHGSLYLLPVLLARLGRVEIGQTGGCRIGDAGKGGARPVHHMIQVLERFGARFDTSGEVIRGECRGLHGARIDIREFSDHPRVVSGPLVSGATKTALLAGACARGTTVVEHPYRKPDVTELLAFFRAAGVPVEDEGDRVSIEGRPSLRPTRFHLVSDVMEVVTFAACAVHLQVPLRLTGVTTERVRAGLVAELELFERMGVPLRWEEDAVELLPAPSLRGGLDIEVTSRSIYSDNHPFFTLMLMSADAPSRIREAVWQHRFDYAHQLARLGARLHVEGPSVRVEPGRPDRAGERVHGSDLRSAAVLVLAALGIEGETLVTGASHLERGYEDLLGKLRNLGAEIAIEPGTQAGA